MSKINYFKNIPKYLTFLKLISKEFRFYNLMYGNIYLYKKLRHYITVVVLFNWALFALTVFGLVLLLDPVGSTKLNDGQSDTTVDTLRHKKVTRVWVRRFRWLFCWIMRDEHSHEAFSQVAGLYIFLNTYIYFFFRFLTSSLLIY